MSAFAEDPRIREALMLQNEHMPFRDHLLECLCRYPELFYFTRKSTSSTYLYLK